VRGDDGEENWGERGVRSAAGGFLWRPSGAGGEEKWAGGPGFDAVWRGKMGKRALPLGTAGDSSGDRWASAASLPRDREAQWGASD
jgi:hypothetical protein